MGEAKRRQTFTERLLQEQPYCIYCGGETLAETTDHIPPVTMFYRRDRPKGLEFSACKFCNEGSRKTDQAIGLISRLHPSPPDSFGEEEIKNLTKNIYRFNPDLLQEMLAPNSDPTVRELQTKIYSRSGAGLLNGDGPIMKDIMGKFSAKLGMALHYERCKRILSEKGYITGFWYPNLRIVLNEEDTIRELESMFESAKTLRQGRKNVSEQFQYDSLYDPDTITSAHYATFRTSFAIVVLVSEGSDKYQIQDAQFTYRPGCLKE